MCEGTLRNLSVSTGGDGGRGSLVPGQWYFFVLQIDPRKFDYRNNDVAIQVRVQGRRRPCLCVCGCGVGPKTKPNQAACCKY